jgi:hypothetical protein
MSSKILTLLGGYCSLTAAGALCGAGDRIEGKLASLSCALTRSAT